MISPARTYKNDPFSKKKKSFNDLIGFEEAATNKVVHVITLDQVIDRLRGYLSETSAKSSKKLTSAELKGTVFIYLSDSSTGVMTLAEAWSFDLLPVADRKVSDDQKTPRR